MTQCHGDEHIFLLVEIKKSQAYKHDNLLKERALCDHGQHYLVYPLLQSCDGQQEGVLRPGVAEASGEGGTMWQRMWPERFLKYTVRSMGNPG